MTAPKLTCEQQLAALRKEYEEFTYIVSHDLKAPLRSISNLSGWIKEDLGDHLEPEVQHNLDLLQNRTERLEGMVNGLLDLSRVWRYDLEVREVNVQTLLQQLAADLKQSSSLVVHLSPLPTLSTYAKKLETVFRHLLQNAVTYNEKDSREVWVEATAQDGFYLFKVIDNGIGIAEEAQEKVFNMFYAVQPKDSQHGLGIGLPLVRKIIQFVGGAITVHSVPGQGAEFTFSWPKAV